MKNRKNLYRGTLVCDIDGVIADLEGAFVDAFGSNHRDVYYFTDRYPEHTDTIIEWIESPATYADLSPIFSGLLFLRQAYSRGWYIWLVSSRPKSDEMMRITAEWLDKYGAKFHEFSLSGDKNDSIRSYNHLHPDKPVRIVVDDSLDVLETIDPKIYSVAWAQMWNTGFYPRMWYDPETMRVLVQAEPDSSPVGAWELKK